MTHNSLAPADACANEQAIFRRNILQNFAILSPQPFRGLSRGVSEQIDEACALKGQDSEFGEQLLLANTQTERASGRIVKMIATGFSLNERFVMIRQWAHSRR